MIDFQQKRQLNKVIYSKVTFFVLLVLVFFMGKATYGIYKKTTISASNYAAVEKGYQNLKTRKDMLESEIDRLQTERGVEEEIRSRFSVAKPGETVVTIVKGSSTSETTTNPKGGFWSSFLNIFR